MVLRWIRDGVDIRWNALGPPPPFDMGESVFSPDEVEFLRSEIRRCLASGAWEVAPQGGPQYVSRASVVPKASGGFRLVVDLRPINSRCVERAPVYEDLRDLRWMARPEDYLFSLDLQDGYHHLGIRPEDRRFFQFRLFGVVYQCAALPFGWNLSPWCFTKFMEPMVSHLRCPASGATEAPAPTPPPRSRKRKRNGRSRPPPSPSEQAHLRGLRCLPYLDDFLLMIQGPRSEALVARARVESLLSVLALRRNVSKGHWEPARRLEHLGYTVDTEAGTFGLTAKRLSKLHALAQQLLSGAQAGGFVLARSVASFCGLANSAALAVGPVRSFLRALHSATAGCLSSRDFSRPVRLSDQAVRDLHWWLGLQLGGPHSCLPIWPTRPTTPFISVHCDASDLGWGARMLAPAQRSLSGLWSPEQRARSITWRELRAVRFMVQQWGPLLRNGWIRLGEDNQGVVAILSSLTSPAPDLMEELRELWWLLETSNIRISSLYVRSEDNLADGLSRLVPHSVSEIRIRRSVFATLHQDPRWGNHQVDRFSTSSNALLPRFNTLFLDVAMEGVDAFAQEWSGTHSWVFPPVPLLARVSYLLRVTPSASATVIAPFWPGKAWFLDLSELAEESRLLGSSSAVLRPSPDGGVLPLWSWMAFRVPCRV